MSPASGPIPPGATLGIVGGGQLGRMTALAAARLGYRCHVLTPEADGPAVQVAADATIAAYDDEAALARFADAVDVVTCEFENVPHATLLTLAARVPVRPGPEVFRIAQHRVLEKRFMQQAGIPTAPWRAVDSEAALDGATAALGLPAILKTARFGYDGKGQVLLSPGSDPVAAWAALGGVPAILEGFVAFEREVSVIVARAVDGAVSSYVPVENRHRDHILHETVAPARLPVAVGDAACDLAQRLAEALDLVGLVALELFVLADGRLLANEIAPRPHNSGHWTIDACAVSQFEQCVRAVCGLPLGVPERHSDAVMTNLIGQDATGWEALLREPGACLHLYGKAEVRPGRKMGHVTRIRPRSDG